MRRRGLLGVLGGLAACAVAPAAASAARAAAQELAFDLNVSGTVTASWHGDPARGCAAAGMCGYSGSAVLQPSGSATVQLSGFGLSDSLGASLQPIVVRVRRERADGQRAGVCLDAIPTSGDPFSIEPLGGSRLRIGLGGPDANFGFSPLSGSGLSSGRCAGPRPADLAGTMPSAVIDIGRLTRRGLTVDLAGRKPFAVGAFSGEVISTVRFAVRPPASQGFSSDSGVGARPPRARRTRVVRYLEASLRYRIQPTVGSFVTDLAGVADPACLEFDVCGATGRLTYGFTTLGGTLDVSGAAQLRGAAPRGVNAALAYVQRTGGQFEGTGQLKPHSGQTVEQLTADGNTCSDTAAAELPPLEARSRGAGMVLELAPPSFEFGDQLRTRCPGPTQADVLGRRPLAVGLLPPGALMAPRARVALRDAGAFSTEAFSGSSSGGAVLQMRRASVRVRVVRVREVGGR